MVKRSSLGSAILRELGGAWSMESVSLVSNDVREPVANVPFPSDGPTLAPYCTRGRWYVKVTTAPGERKTVAFPRGMVEAEVAERAELAARLTDALRRHGQDAFLLETATNVATLPLTRLPEVETYVLTQLCSGRYVKKGTRTSSAAGRIDLARRDLTVKQFATAWTRGELNERWPDSVKEKKTAAQDVGRLEKYVFPVIGDRPIRSLGMDDYEDVMQRIPRDRSASTRRHVAQLLRRLSALAVYPARLLTVDPLGPVKLPRLVRKDLACLYPSEEQQLLGCTSIPLVYRVAYGVLAREGCRLGELLGDPTDGREPLRWASVDLVRGTVRIVDTKTNEERTWVLDPSVVRTLTRYRQGAADQSPVLPGASKMNLAARLREHLLEAGVTRAELLESNSRRRAFRAHDLRAFFVTSALAAGRSEAWVMARTGHDSSQMLNKYRRNTAHWTELGLSTVAPLDEAIPDLPVAPPPRGPGSTSSSSSEDDVQTQFEESANASAEVSAPASAGSPADDEFPGDLAQFRRRDSNPNSRNQNPLSCH